MRKARKIQLTIKADSGADGYLPTWSIYEGVREVIQNAKDAETQFDAPMSVEFYKGNTGRQTLRITNEGCNLDKEALLFGHTTKFGNRETIGQYGEGLKLGLLVLVRAGVTVKIFTGNDNDGTGEVWIPTIERSDTFNANVLTIHVKDAKYRKRVRVEIEGLSEDEWNGMKDKFLFLPGNSKGDYVKTRKGELLKDEKYKGQIYVKGIWVESRDTDYGYNFFDAELDRDRKMVDWYSFDTNVGRILDEATSSGEFASKDLFNMLHTDSKDTSGFCVHTYLTESVEAIKNEFIAKYGEDAIPLENNEQVSVLGHLTGSKGIVVPKALREVLKKSFGDFEEIKQKLESETTIVYTLDELEENEKENYTWAVGALNMGLKEMGKEKLGLYSASVCDFNSKSILGQHQGNMIRIARSILNNRTLTLRVLIHEYAHEFGGDGEKSHISSIEKIWQHIMSALTDSVLF
ncbi:MAG TPA: hypothetical protein VMX17_08945 [Candidatus Glassbacteria bacterium]|nr:hypothetical protein [Candidatus Glassbacteria bacterium]